MRFNAKLKARTEREVSILTTAVEAGVEAAKCIEQFTRASQTSRCSEGRAKNGEQFSLLGPRCFLISPRDVIASELSAGDEVMLLQRACDRVEPMLIDRTVCIAESDQWRRGSSDSRISRGCIPLRRFHCHNFGPHQVDVKRRLEKGPCDVCSSVVRVVVDRHDFPWFIELLVRQTAEQHLEILCGIQHRNHNSDGRTHSLSLTLIARRTLWLPSVMEDVSRLEDWTALPRAIAGGEMKWGQQPV